MKQTQIVIGILVLLGTGLTNQAYNCECEEAAANGNYCKKWKCDPDTAACFSRNSIVTLANGQKKMIQNLKEGDMLMTIDPKTLKKTGTDFIDQIHLVEDLKTEFQRFTLESGETLEASEDHILYTQEQGHKQAFKIKVGHTMITENGFSKVANIKTIEEVGLYAPQTSDIGLFVNGIYVTGIAKFEHIPVALRMSRIYKKLKSLPVIGEIVSQRTSKGILNYYSFLEKAAYGFNGIGLKIFNYLMGIQD